MSLHIRTAITCDHSMGCKEMVLDDDKNARRIARAQGWVLVRRGGHTLDLCPAHKNGAAS